MIKATRKDEVVPKKTEYPQLMAGDHLVVLFSMKGKGMVVEGKGTHFYNSVGHTSDMWAMETFSPYKGKIILENK